MALDDIVEESQTSTLSTQGAFTDTGKVGILIELHSIKDCHDSKIFHMTILHNGIKDNLTVGIHILKFLPGDMLQKSRYREDGPGTQPAAHVITTDVIKHRVVRNIENIILQFLQTADTHDLLMSLRISENEIAKAHMFLHQTAQIYTHLLGVLIYKTKTFSLCLCSIFTLRTLKDKGHKGIILSDITEKLQTRIWTFFTTKGICSMLWLHILIHNITKSFGCTL